MQVKNLEIPDPSNTPQLAADTTFVVAVVTKVEGEDGGIHCRRYYNSLLTSGICRIVCSMIFELVAQVQQNSGFHRQGRISVSLKKYHSDIDIDTDVDTDECVDVAGTGVGTGRHTYGYTSIKCIL